jgi:phenylacetate-CoA ligase
MARYEKFIRRYRPQKIFAYSSALYLMARYLNRKNWQPERGWPRVVFTTAEPLHDFQRRMIESVFGCPASMEYGSREAGLIANECPAGGFHVSAEAVMVEVLQESSQGTEMGEIVVTNLHSWAMPIIRYRTQDICKGLMEEPCRCGRELPRLASVDGRRSDFLVTPRGRVIHGQAAAYLLRETESVRESIREFQIIQDTVDSLMVKVVPADSFSPLISSIISECLLRLFDTHVRITIEVVEKIDRLASGKRRDVISKIADRYLEAVISGSGDQVLR